MYAAAACSAGCSSRDRTSGPGSDVGPKRTDGSAADATVTDAGDPSADDAGPPARDASSDAGDGGPAPGDVTIYAHSNDTLYSFSPDTLRVREIGPFERSGGGDAPFMLDLAVDGEGNVFTSSDHALYRVNPETAEVTKIGDFDLSDEQLFALSFLHEGAYRKGEETLVGATNAGVYYEVNRNTAETSYMGTYPDGWLSSGDIVSVEGLGTFATALRSDSPGDVLVEIEFAGDGSSSVSVKGPIAEGDHDYAQIFGIGFWRRALYGFSNSGELIRIDRRSGEAELLSDDTGTDQFWGAGVTTQAPVVF